MVRATRIVSGGKAEGCVGARDAAGEYAQQAIGKIVEIALALAPIGIVLTQHARARAVLHALHGRLGRQAGLDRLAQPPHPALVVGEHAIGLEHVAMLAGTRQVLVIEHFIERGAQGCDRRLQPDQLLGRILGHEMRDDDARLVQDDVPERDAVGHLLALDHRRQRLLQLDRRAGPGHGARYEMLGDDHRRRLQHLDILVGVFLLGAVLHDEHAEHLTAAPDRHRQQRVVDLLARLRPVGERRVARRLRLVDRDVELGAAADEAFAALHARRVHGARVETFAGEQLERAVLPLEVDRADLGDHDAGDLLDDLVEARLAVIEFGHDLAQTPHDHTQRRLGCHHSWLVASPLHRSCRPGGSAGMAGSVVVRARTVRAQSASRP